MERRPRRVRGRRHQRGNAAIIVGLCIVMLIGFASMVVDIGYLYETHNDLQNAADAAALAGARMLDRTVAGVAAARNTVVEYAGNHQATGSDVNVANSDIIFGHWHITDNDECAPAPCFQPYGTEPSAGDAPFVNAVRVIARRTAATNDPVDHFFAPVIGIANSDVVADAIAIAGGPRSECAFPFTVSECEFNTVISQGLCEYCLQNQSSLTDNSGFTSFGTGPVSGPVIQNLIAAACTDGSGNVIVDPATGECMGACNEVIAGGDTRVNNGNLMNTSGGGFCMLVNRILRRGVVGGPAIPFTVRVPVLEAEDCSSGFQFSNSHPIIGYATMDILGIKCGSSDAGIFASGSSCTPPPSDKYVMAALRCDLESNGVAGGEYFGTNTIHMRLVE